MTCRCQPILILFAAFTIPNICVASGEAEPQRNVTVDLEKIKLAAESEATITCTTLLDQKLLWINPNGTEISMDNSSRIHQQDNKLVITKGEVTDSGEYTCTVPDRRHNATTVITVYIMPNYFKQGMYILILNAILIVIFLSCLAYHHVKDMKERKKYGQYTKRMTVDEKVVKQEMQDLN